MAYMYSYYMTGYTRNQPYSKTIGVFIVILLLHYMTLAIYFGWNHIDFYSQSTELWRILMFILIYFPINYLICMLFPETKILRQLRKEKNLKKGRHIAFAYIVFSIALFVITVLTVKDIIF
jgi:hypothetical protein